MIQKKQVRFKRILVLACCLLLLLLYFFTPFCYMQNDADGFSDVLDFLSSVTYIGRLHLIVWTCNWPSYIFTLDTFLRDAKPAVGFLIIIIFFLEWFMWQLFLRPVWRGHFLWHERATLWTSFFLFCISLLDLRMYFNLYLTCASQLMTVPLQTRPSRLRGTQKPLLLQRTSQALLWTLPTHQRKVLY